MNNLQQVEYQYQLDMILRILDQRRGVLKAKPKPVAKEKEKEPEKKVPIKQEKVIVKASEPKTAKDVPQAKAPEHLSHVKDVIQRASGRCLWSRA